MRAMASTDRTFLTLLLLFLAVTPSFGAAPTSAERTELHRAQNQFDMFFYALAEKAADDFCRSHTNSALLPEAFLLQAKARFEQSNYVGASELLLSHFNPRDPLADDYLYYLGLTQGKRGQYREAAGAFDRLTREYPASVHLLDASIQQAVAYSMIPEWHRTINLLSQTNGVFQSVARTNSPGDLVFRGFLLLSQAQMAVSNYSDAEATLRRFDKSLLNPTNAWQRQYLICQIQLADGRAEEALQNTTNLLSMAGNTLLPAVEAESAAFRAGILENLSRLDEAITNYNRNLVEGRPTSRQRQAILKISELSIRQNKINEGAGLLEQFLAQYPDSNSADLGLLTLGELRLRQFEERAGTNDFLVAATNLLAQTNLAQAHSSFETLVKKFPQSAFFPKGELDLGWCYWFENRMPECQQALQTAITTLPHSTELALAYFKLADAQFRQGNFRGATNNYEALIRKFASLPLQSSTVSNLIEPALYQEIRASLAIEESDAATNALGRILTWYPNGFHTERAVLLTGQAISNAGDPPRARSLFTGFMNVVSSAASIPEVQLAIARTYERENDWTNAIQQYERWLNTFTNHPARPQAEYFRACAISQTGDKTNAFMTFTNFIARFPTNDFAAPAQWWVADFYYAVGAFSSAENGYQTIFTQWPKSDLAYQAQMMAGRAAFKRQSLGDADKYFTNLCNNPNCPVDLRFEALFAHGDTLGNDGSDENYKDAMNVFRRIASDYSTNKLAALALGQRACYALQWAKSSPDFDKYDTVSNAFLEVINSPQADARATNIATIGLGVVLEKLAQQRPDEARKFREQALEQYVNAFLDEGQPEIFWTKFAGNEAGRLAYEMREWQKAIKIYQRLQKILPASLPSIQNKIQDCERNLTRVSSKG
jgi:outer membrane protein assembly factor BamD (BamD/ComL family)/predicted negative regulator of RcsB-dependent stress response